MRLLERVCRALCEVDGNPADATMYGKPLWMDYLPQARAVLLTIRNADNVLSASAVSLGSSLGNRTEEELIELRRSRLNPKTGRVP